MINRVIVNIAIGEHFSWYHNGQNRLRESLKQYDPQSDLYFTTKISRATNPYHDKVLQIKNAVDNGYTKVLWLDCSITAIRPLDDIWEYIDQKGYYLYKSGYNCAQTSNDHSLSVYGINRDIAERMDECASNVVGFDLATPEGKEFYEGWIKGLYNGAMEGRKWPKKDQRLEESTDPRFQFHRQDQTTASLAANLAGIKMEEEGHYVSRKENGTHPSTIFVLAGGF